MGFSYCTQEFLCPKSERSLATYTRTPSGAAPDAMPQGKKSDSSVTAVYSIPFRILGIGYNFIIYKFRRKRCFPGSNMANISI